MTSQKKNPNTLVVAANVRRVRNKLRWSQAKLAKISGMTREGIAYVETAAHKTVKSSTIEAIAAALGVPQAELVTAHPSMAKPLPAMKSFLSSNWIEALRPTDDEKRWLSALPMIVYDGLESTDEALAELLQWRRRQERKGEINGPRKVQ